MQFIRCAYVRYILYLFIKVNKKVVILNNGRIFEGGSLYQGKHINLDISFVFNIIFFNIIALARITRQRERA